MKPTIWTNQDVYPMTVLQKLAILSEMVESLKAEVEQAIPTIPPKATTEQAETGIDDSCYTTPKTAKIVCENTFPKVTNCSSALGELSVFSGCYYVFSGQVYSLTLTFISQFADNVGHDSYIRFFSGSIPTSLIINTSNTTPLTVTPSANCICEILAEWDNSSGVGKWVLSYREVSL